MRGGVVAVLIRHYYRVARRPARLPPMLQGIGRLSGRVSRAVLDAVLPPRCLKCGEILDGAQGLCPECWRRLSWLGAPCWPLRRAGWRKCL